MSLAFGAYAISIWEPNSLGRLLPRNGYWELSGVLAGISWLKYAFHYAVGAIMGFSFLVTAPDAWKRIYVVTTQRKATVGRFLVFVGTGFLPFLLILPVALAIPAIPDGIIQASEIYRKIPTNEYLFVIAGLGLTSCFLSAFDSALIAATQVIIIIRRGQKPILLEAHRFNWVMVGVLLAIFAAFELFNASGNPYLLGNILLGPYAIVAGIQAGTSAKPASLPRRSILWIVVISMAAWMMYVINTIGVPRVPTTFQFNTVPVGMSIAIGVCCSCVLFRYVEGKQWFRN